MTNENKDQTCQLLSAKTLGQMLSLSKRQVFRLNSCGRLPKPVRIGGSVRWIESEISEFIKAGAPERKTWEAMKGGKDA
jgi:predicted DNA-binding transcriptional regulator AlpA